MPLYAPIPQLQANRQRLRNMLRQDPRTLTPLEYSLRATLLKVAQRDVCMRAARMFEKKTSRGPMIVIKPVGDGCNYRCVYCFHQEELGDIQPMRLDVLEKIYQGVKSVYGTTAHLLWHGGEPLLAGKEFYQQAFALQEKVFGKVIHNAVQTNGSLLDEEYMKFFRKHNVALGFSLDGGAEINGRTRRNAAGRNGYDATVRGIGLVLQTGMTTGVITVITRGRTDARTYYAAMKELGVTGININPAIHPELRPTNEAFTQFVCEVIQTWLEDSGAGPHPRILEFFIPMLMGRYFKGGCIWSGTCAGIIEIQPDGRVKGLCDRNVDFSRLPQAAFGNLLTDPPEEVFKGQQIRAFTQLAMQQPLECQGCPLSWTCRGGCMHHRMEINHTMVQPDPFCGYYQNLFAYLQSVIDQVRDFPAVARAPEPDSSPEEAVVWIDSPSEL